VDRRKPGSKHNLIVDANGVPLAQILTGANRHDVKQLMPLVDAIPPIGGKVGAPLKKPKLVMGDRGYSSKSARKTLAARGIATQLAGRQSPHGSGLGVFRWCVEQSLSLMHQFKRLRVRDDRDDQIHEAFMDLASVVICWRRNGS
jgi:transposase